MYYTHEYSDEDFETYEECQNDLVECLDEQDIVGEIDLSLEEIISRFLYRASNQNFINWLEDKILGAEQSAIDNLITEYEEGEVE